MFKNNQIVRLLGRLIALVLLLTLSRYSYAQNTGALPYLDSEHSYRVQIGSTANRKVWNFTDGTTTFNLYDDDGGIIKPDWATILPTGNGIGQAEAGYHGVQLYFDRSVFAPGDVLNPNWNLEYLEYDADHSCVAARRFPIVVSDNTFYLALSADGTTCNSQSGNPHDYADVDGIEFPTTVSYRVTMTKADNFKPTYWTFDGVFSEAVQNISVTSTAGTPGAIAWSPLTTPGTDYTITVTPEAGSPATVILDIEVTFLKEIHAQVVPTFTVSNGMAVVAAPPAPNAETEDDITVIDGDPIRQQAITILPVPKTRDIEANVALGEADWSAFSPMQNSTHDYRVQMGNVANTVGLKLLDADLNEQDADGGNNYVITNKGIDGTNSYSQFSIVFKERAGLPQAIYYIEFTETIPDGTYNCSSVRRQEVELVGPLDLVLAANIDDCSDADGVIYSDVTAETTSIEYNVNLSNVNYDATWKYNLVLTCGELGGALTAPNITISGDGAAIGAILRPAGTITIPVVVTKAADPVEKNVTVTVNYTGIYASEHTITATLVAPGTPASFGSYGEIDGDATNNTDTHIIYKMPQAGELAGVD